MLGISSKPTVLGPVNPASCPSKRESWKKQTIGSTEGELLGWKIKYKLWTQCVYTFTWPYKICFFTNLGFREHLGWGREVAIIWPDIYVKLNRGSSYQGVTNWCTHSFVATTVHNALTKRTHHHPDISGNFSRGKVICTQKTKWTILFDHTHLALFFLDSWAFSPKTDIKTIYWGHFVQMVSQVAFNLAGRHKTICSSNLSNTVGPYVEIRLWCLFNQPVDNLLVFYRIIPCMPPKHGSIWGHIWVDPKVPKISITQRPSLPTDIQAILEEVSSSVMFEEIFISVKRQWSEHWTSEPDQ